MQYGMGFDKYLKEWMNEWMTVYNEGLTSVLTLHTEGIEIKERELKSQVLNFVAHSGSSKIWTANFSVVIQTTYPSLNEQTSRDVNIQVIGFMFTSIKTKIPTRLNKVNIYIPLQLNTWQNAHNLQ